MGRFYAFACVLVLVAAPKAILAQQIVPAGVVSRRQVPSSTAPSRNSTLPRVIGLDSAQGHPWRWIGAGAVVGGAASGIAAAVSVSRTDDAFFPGQFIAAASALGAAVGGLLGGLFYLVFH